VNQSIHQAINIFYNGLSNQDYCKIH